MSYKYEQAKQYNPHVTYGMIIAVLLLVFAGASAFGYQKYTKLESQIETCREVIRKDDQVFRKQAEVFEKAQKNLKENSGIGGLLVIRDIVKGLGNSFNNVENRAKKAKKCMPEGYDPAKGSNVI